jgi:ABC-type lipoprotein export system ATPase subunit
MIDIKNLSKSFSSGNAFNNLSLKVKSGEFVAIVGPSGSGKSTLLHLIAALDSPSDGCIIINKQDISNFNDRQASHYRNQQVGFIFQEFYLEPFLTTKENVLLPTRFHKKDNNAKSEQLADKLLKEVELSSKTDAKPSELSGGQKQRSAIARALINNPPILLADEPTGNLDPKTSGQIIKLLKQLHKNHKITLIVATHDQDIAKAADRVINILDISS